MEIPRGRSTSGHGCAGEGVGRQIYGALCAYLARRSVRRIGFVLANFDLAQLVVHRIEALPYCRIYRAFIVVEAAARASCFALCSILPSFRSLSTLRNVSCVRRL